MQSITLAIVSWIILRRYVVAGFTWSWILAIKLSVLQRAFVCAAIVRKLYLHFLYYFHCSMESKVVLLSNNVDVFQVFYAKFFSSYSNGKQRQELHTATSCQTVRYSIPVSVYHYGMIRYTSWPIENVRKGTTTMKNFGVGNLKHVVWEENNFWRKKSSPIM